jgi:mRNA interferase MazF
VNHGDVFWVELPDRGGREQRGRRPAIIWQDTEAYAGLPTILVVPLTSRLSASRFPGTLRVEPTVQNGLTVPSVALLFQLGACDLDRIQGQLGRLDDEDVRRIATLAKRLQKLG